MEQSAVINIPVLMGKGGMKERVKPEKAFCRRRQRALEG
jgi:hypothetical protein